MIRGLYFLDPLGGLGLHHLKLTERVHHDHHPLGYDIVEGKKTHHEPSMLMKEYIAAANKP